MTQVGRFVLAVALMAAVALPATAMAQGKRNAAIVIGISQYQDQNITDLNFADSDANEIEYMLKTWGGYAPECVLKLVNSQATGGAIRDAFRRIDSQCRRGGPSLGHVLVYYSGHAVLAAKQFEKNRGQAREFLAPHDAFLGETFKSGDGSTRNDTFITKEEIASRLTRLRADGVTLVLDACHSGMPDFTGMITTAMGYSPGQISIASGSDLSTKGLAVFKRTSGGPSAGGGIEKKIALIAASNEQNVSLEFDELKHGALTYAILDSMQLMRDESPAGRSENLSVARLYRDINYTFGRTKVKGRRLSSYHQPRIFVVPDISHDQMTFSSITGGLQPVKTTGFLALQTEPPGAAIEVNGQPVAQSSNATIELPAGSHKVVLQLPGTEYRHVMAVNVRVGETTNRSVAFKGSLSVRSVLKSDPNRAGPDLVVYLDGQRLGITNLNKTGIVAGRHDLRVVYKGSSHQKQISIRPDSTLSMRYLVTIRQAPGGGGNEGAPRRKQIDVY